MSAGLPVRVVRCPTGDKVHIELEARTCDVHVQSEAHGEVQFLQHVHWVTALTLAAELIAAARAAATAQGITSEEFITASQQAAR